MTEHYKKRKDGTIKMTRYGKQASAILDRAAKNGIGLESVWALLSILIADALEDEFERGLERGA